MGVGCTGLLRCASLQIRLFRKSGRCVFIPPRCSVPFLHRCDAGDDQVAHRTVGVDVGERIDRAGATLWIWRLSVCWLMLPPSRSRRIEIVLPSALVVVTVRSSSRSFRWRAEHPRSSPHCRSWSNRQALSSVCDTCLRSTTHRPSKSVSTVEAFSAADSPLARSLQISCDRS
jgi:hypothetical protein